MATIHRRIILKDLDDPDNHSGVITHLEPDILGCQVKTALGSITTNKSSGGDRIPAELFVAQMVKNLPANAGDMSLIPGSERSPGKGNGNPFHYPCLENSMDRGAWRATVCGVRKESDMTEQLGNNRKHWLV